MEREPKLFRDIVIVAEKRPKHSRGTDAGCPCSEKDRSQERLFSFVSDEAAAKTAENKKASLEKLRSKKLNITRSDVINSSRVLALKAVDDVNYWERTQRIELNGQEICHFLRYVSV